MKNLTHFTKDLENKKLYVTRKLNAPIELVWSAWTEAELLDQWWAPKPYKTITKSMNFNEGGFWLYYMLSPEGDKHWCRVDYLNIEKQTHFSAKDVFCDENGIPNEELPKMLWNNQFKSNEDATEVKIEISFDKVEDIQKMIEMGFKEGFTAALENLDNYIQQKFKIRNELKTNNTPRVTTYLNFPGNTEEAFIFYKSVFKTEFSGKGIQRFGDIPAESGHPPVSESIKKMVLHVELPILGGHVLMATDAPKEMGFTLNQGNNMHICLEPDSREETQRLFDALSKGGTITMPLEDMFFGSFFGECSDKYGINWMFNFKNTNN
ncbi:SRPBCC domain-containing protein [Mariniflexile litorale]|uniref:SRPBCC domain-containing protein n=1 Tax=Mariniflexile litorale TaxID=3045158 RepID=A0AAU7EG92_9FLAO|nr:SRPBCC domain-containing protein [Mariniflexile sp. KMM 9835]MDQ8212038.1 SRPBCC domain-containing protein [Mariniflexile sp. KMM 9835]